MARRLKIKWGSGSSVTARLTVPKRPSGNGILLAHGAGAGQDHPFMVLLRDTLADRGLTAMTFNYAYTEAQRRAPDRMPKLLEVHRAAADRLATYCDNVVLGGKSMGGRVGSHLAGDHGWEATGLVYYGYPLVALGKTEPRDTRHLHEINVPQLFLAGGRDRMSPPDLIEPLALSLIDATAVVIEGGDHSFKLPKRMGRTEAEVVDELADHTTAWLAG